MPIDGVNQYSGVSSAYTSSSTAKTAETETKAAEEIKQKEDSFVKSTETKPVTYKPDMKKISEMKAELASNMSGLRVMVQSLMGEQGKQAVTAMGNLGEFFAGLEVDDATRLAAQESISEDGYWGVEATAGRILDFAKAISGGDPEKIELLRKAVEDGFSEAERIWGGKLPDISYQTRERVMAGFDEWAKEARGETEDPKTETEAGPVEG